MFYFIFWSIWVYVTFILKKENPYRLKVAATVLISILFADVSFTIGNFRFFGSGLFLLIQAYMILKKEQKFSLAYFFICSSTITLAYTAFHLFEIFDPIWIIVKKEWMLGIALSYLAILLRNNLKGRLLILISGTMQGEFLYAYILSKYDFPYPIAAPAYLDAFALTAVLLVGWSLLEQMGVYFEQHTHSLNKGKQKSS